MTYRGRFAPSPTGPLHLGSLVAAIGSYLQARRANGIWLVRIEDLDPPRTIPGAADHILHALQTLGFRWDEPVVWQSQRSAMYEQALNLLIERGLTYPCSCTRSELQGLVEAPAVDGDELRYPGRCAHGPMRADGPHAWRLRVDHQAIEFNDGLQGSHCIDLQQSIGDFVIKRRDGWFAYQLAVVVDDAAQGITEVVRGYDLLLNTPRQIAVQRALSLATPRYLHLPLITDRHGHKLAKSSHAAPIDVGHAGPTLWRALQLLQQSPPAALQSATVSQLWEWAIANWQPERLQFMRSIAE